MTHDEYAALEGERWSTLNKILDSPAHYREHADNGRKDTHALIFGNAVHTLAFEPIKFGAQFASWPTPRRGKVWTDFKRANADKIILSATDFEHAAEMANAVRTHPLVIPYLAGGRFEVPMQWQDLATGIACKARTDWIQPQRRVVLELKTTRSIETTLFGFDVRRYRYAGQLAFYAQGVAAALGWIPERLVIVAVEKSPPYDVGVFDLDTSAKLLGLNEAAEALSRLNACRASGRWPGRYETEQTLLLPTYATDDLDMGDLPEED